MRWVEQPVFFIDFEGSHAAGILEYGVVTVLGDRVVEANTRLCRAAGHVRGAREETAMHGLRENRLTAAQARRLPIISRFLLACASVARWPRTSPVWKMR